MSRARRRGLARLAVLLLGLTVGVVLIATIGVSDDSQKASEPAANGTQQAAPALLKASAAPVRLPRPLHGEAVAAGNGGLLVIGGADRSGASTDKVLRLDPEGPRIAPAGRLVERLHDAAAASVAGKTLVFGGGSATTLDTVQELVPGDTAKRLGSLPDALSDLSAVRVGDTAYIVGGFDGQQPAGSVLRTSNGYAFTQVARLPTAVRYAAVAASGQRIYSFGGELGTGTDTDQIQEYDIATGRVSVVGHLPASLSHAAPLALDGGVYLLGGRRAGAASDQMLRFDPARNVTVPAGRLPEPIFDGAAGSLRNVGYLIGGIGAQDTSVDSIISLVGR